MKKLIVILLACLLAFGNLFACADQGISLFTAMYGVTINTPGVYAELTNPLGELYSGPGDDYTNVGTFDWNHTRMHCLSQAYDRYGTTWVLIEYDDLYLSWRGYVRLSEFSASDRRFIAENLPYEKTYDELTPRMLAQMYFSCDGYYGPGEEDFIPMYTLDYRVVQGTIIMSSGDWALLELNPYTIQAMGLYAKCRLWVPLSNLMY